MSVFFLPRLTSNLDERDLLLLKSISLVIFICQVGCLATINFSFGFFLAVFTIPAFLFVRSTQNRYALCFFSAVILLHYFLNRFLFLFCRLRRLCQVVFVLASSPPVIIFFMTVLYSYFTTDNEVLHSAKTLYLEGILSSLRDSVLLGTWTYPVTLLIILPNWLMFWSIAWM
jgi:hypothetical protein